MESKKTVNIYVCENAHTTITKDVDECVTPMFIKCTTCERMAASLMYRANQLLKHSREFFLPKTFEELKEHIFEYYEDDRFTENDIKMMWKECTQTKQGFLRIAKNIPQ